MLLANQLRDIHIITMTSPLKAFTSLDELEHVETWISYFAVMARFEKLEDEKASKGESEITYLFMVLIGLETVKKISTMTDSRQLEELTYEEIFKNIQQKRLVTDKTKFIKTRLYLNDMCT